MPGHQPFEPVRIGAFLFSQKSGEVRAVGGWQGSEIIIHQHVHDGLADHLAFLIFQDAPD